MLRYGQVDKSAISPEDEGKKFIVDPDLNPGYQMALRCVICVEDDIMETS